jgi:hypothetical protein
MFPDRLLVRAARKQQKQPRTEGINKGIGGTEQPIKLSCLLIPRPVAGELAAYLDP